MNMERIYRKLVKVNGATYVRIPSTFVQDYPERYVELVCDEKKVIVSKV